MDDMRTTAENIFRCALAAVDPEQAVLRECASLRTRFQAGKFERLLVIGFGKAAWPMARAIDASLSELPATGVIVTKYGHRGEGQLARIRCLEAGHPLPDANGVKAAEEIIRLAAEADERTLAVILISGGGSALLVSPFPGITLVDKQQTTELLLKSGADIRELNMVRKHLSRVKGGRLAELLNPAASISLILSDVLGDPLDVIASGPTVPDPSTYGGALAVLERYRLAQNVPVAVDRHLRAGMDGFSPETPKESAAAFLNTEHRIIGNLAIALDGAKRCAEALGLKVEPVSAEITGEAREAGKLLARKAREAKQSGGRLPVCLLSGGETTVTVTGAGTGGRNMELALGFAREIGGTSGITLLSAGTDGNDGPTDAAGAFADGMTVPRGRAKGLDLAKYLAANDSYNYFQEEGGLFITGPTGTNVMDLQIVVIE
jgi:glycerate 2-kinase